MALGTTENVPAPASTGNVTSGTATDAMIKAATAASSAEPAPAGAAAAGDTPPKIPQAQGDTPAGTTAQSAAAAQSGTTDARGPMPLDRHEQILANARKEFEWAKQLTDAGLTPAEIKTAIGLLKRLRGDAKAFHAQLGQELAQAGGGAPAADEADEAYPEADLRSQDGRQAAYSDKAVLKALEIQERKLTKAFEGRLKPLLDHHTSELERRRAEDLDAQTKATSDAAIAEAMKLPHFKEHRKAIGERLMQIPEETRAQVGPIGAMFLAYNLVLQEKVLPTLSATNQQVVRDEFKQKAATAGGVHPAGASGDGKPPELKNVTDLAAHMERLAAAG